MLRATQRASWFAYDTITDKRITGRVSLPIDSFAMLSYP